jgi:2,3-bisphosphoglycerate-independent phosphoglycerate mutase
MQKKTVLQRIVLVVFDGWGVSYLNNANIFSIAKTPVIDELLKTYPTTVLSAGPQQLCLNKTTTVNSEVGLRVINSGVWYETRRDYLDAVINDKSFFKNSNFLNLIKGSKQTERPWHLIGSLGQDELDLKILEALIQLALRKKISGVYLHLSLERVTENKSLELIKTLELWQERYQGFFLVDLCGTQYATNTNNQWAWTKSYYQLLVEGEGFVAKNPVKIIKKSFERGFGLEKLAPTICYHDYQEAKLTDGDVIIFFNHHGNNFFQLATALTEINFDKFSRAQLNYLNVLSLAPMPADLNINYVFNGIDSFGLLELLERHKLKYALICESEALPSLLPDTAQDSVSDKILNHCLVVSSPLRDHYNSYAQTADNGVIKKAVETIKAKEFDFIEVNIPSWDKVAGSLDHELLAQVVTNIDRQLSPLVASALENNYLLLISSSCARVEKLTDLVSDQAITTNTNNPVPLILVGNNLEGFSFAPSDLGQDLSLTKISGSLLDLAPTILKQLGLEKSKKMIGKNLL